jgi:zinc transport system substrate-binding protein
MKKIMAIFLAILLILLSGCSNDNVSMGKEDKLSVYVSFYPLYYLANEIGKDNINLGSIIPNGVEPHDYEPTIRQIESVGKSDVFVYIGADMEPWSEKVIDTLDKGKTKVVNSSEGIDLIEVNGAVDPHIWLDPMNMNRMALKIKDAFVEKDPDNKAFYEENCEELSKQLISLDEEYKEVLKNKKRNTILVSHEAFGYMAKAYGLKQMPVAGISPNQEPSPKTITKLIDIAKEKNIEYIFLETLASPKTVQIIADEADLDVLVLNPVAGLTKDEIKNGDDYISIMKKNLDNLKKALVD